MDGGIECAASYYLRPRTRRQLNDIRKPGQGLRFSVKKIARAATKPAMAERGGSADGILL